MGYPLALIVAILLGFLAGLLSFRVKTRWCTTCGSVKSCPTCAGWASTAASSRHGQRF